jgi:hypothetical protein
MTLLYLPHREDIRTWKLGKVCLIFNSFRWEGKRELPSSIFRTWLEESCLGEVTNSPLREGTSFLLGREVSMRL